MIRHCEPYVKPKVRIRPGFPTVTYLTAVDLQNAAGVRTRPRSRGEKAARRCLAPTLSAFAINDTQQMGADVASVWVFADIPMMAF